MSKKTWSRLAWAALALWCLAYGPMAIEYMWRFFNPDAPGLWNHLYAGVVDRDEALGAGSIHVEKHDEYAANRGTMLLHTTVGGVAIILFAAQFSARFRRNLKRHRIIGRVAAALALTGMVGAAAYLLAVGPEGTYDGPAFYIQLWALALGTAVGVVLGVSAAVKRQIAMHQAFMAYAFALLLTAPLLRVGYLVFGNTWPETTQLETNMAGAALLSTWAPFGAFLAARSLAGTDRRSKHLSSLPGARLDVLVVLASLLGAVALAVAYDAVLPGFDRVSATGLGAWVLALAVALANLAVAARHGATVALEEWRLITLSLVAALPATGLLWAAYDLPFTTSEAYFGALLTGPALTISLAFVLVTWRRRTIRRPADAPHSAEPVGV